LGILAVYKMAMKSVKNNKIRSFLTMLGVIIGVAAVIASVGFAQGSTKSITDSIEGLGTNLIQITITGRNSNINVSYEELQKFSDENSDEISALAPQVKGSVTVKVGTKSGDTTLNGTSPEYADIKHVGVQSGRYLLQEDIDYRQKVAIVGTAVVNDIFEGSDPVGQTMKINGQVFKVVGVLQETADGADQTDDDQIIIPINVAQRLTQTSTIKNFSLQASDAKYIDDVMAKLNDFLVKKYKNTNSFRVLNQAQMLSTLSNVTNSMMVILAGIAVISLVVGGIGIMNIMLVSVTERTREIGIRKALGAKRKNILIQFLIEALMITGLGGLIGILIGVSIIHFIIGGLNIEPEAYSIQWTLISFGISIIIGVIFGMFPAYKAAKLNPIEALRYE
jgi:putative ABC transport system permease protein